MKKIIGIWIIFFVLAFCQRAAAQCNAGFVYTVSPNGTVTFSSISTGVNPSSVYTWLFPSAVSNSLSGTNTTSASATYTANGTYTVTLSVFTGSALCMTSNVIIVSLPCNMSANYTYTQNANGNIVFFNTTTGTVSGVTYSWDYGDNTTGTLTSHTYSANGIYTVTLNATNNNFTPACQSSFTQTLAVTSSTTPCNVNAQFTYTQAANGQVGFVNNSTGTYANTTYSWNYGDNSTDTLSTHTYSANGIYTVTLSVNNNVSPACQSSKSQTILVNSYCALYVNYSYSVSGNAVTFTNTSVGANAGTMYQWLYGDGNTGITTSLVSSHTYTDYGVYTATLMVAQPLYNQLCVGSSVHTFTIATGCNLTANLSHTLNAQGNANFESVCTGMKENTNYSYYWDFGNGFFSNSSNPQHTFGSGGTHYVKLKIMDTNFPLCADSLIQALNVRLEEITTDIDELKDESIEFKVYPNPANEVLNVSLLTPKGGTIKVFNMLGSVVLEQEITPPLEEKGEASIDVSSLDNGIYFLHLHTANKVFTKKIVVNND